MAIIYSRLAIVFAAFVAFNTGAEALAEDNFAQQQTVSSLRVSWPFPTGNPADAGITEWIKQVEANSDSHLKIISYPHAQLFTEPQTLKGVIDGAVDVGVSTAGSMDKFVPAADVFDIPFLFNGMPAMNAALTPSVTDTFNSAMEPKGAHVLGWFFAGPIDVIGTRGKQVKTPADVVGMKIRGSTNLQMEFLNQLGAQGSIVPQTSSYLQLQTGALDGNFTNLVGGILPYKLYEVIKFITFVPNASNVAFIVSINEHTWRSLTEGQQGALVQATAEARKFEYGFVIQQISDAVGKLKQIAPSVVTYTVSDSDLPNWKKAGEAVRTSFLSGSGPVGSKILNAIDDTERKLPDK